MILLHAVTWSVMSVLVAVNVVAPIGQPVTITFDQEPVGQAPAGWTATQTGTGRAMWSVVQDRTAPTLIFNRHYPSGARGCSFYIDVTLLKTGRALWEASTS